MKNTKRKLKMMALMVAMAAGLLLPTALSAQDNIFGSPIDNQMFGSGGGSINNQMFGASNAESANITNQMFGSNSNAGSIDNQAFGASNVGNITNQTFGNRLPLGSGILIMLAAGAGYAALKRKRVKRGV